MSKSRAMFNRKRRGIDVTRIMSRDGGACVWCGEHLDRSIPAPRDGERTHPMYITFDHIVPRSKGGGDELTNRQLMHARCNQRRGVTPVEDW